MAHRLTAALHHVVRRTFARLAAGLLVVATPWAPTALAQPVPPPAEAYYRNPDILGAALSPSGRWLAMNTKLGGGRAELVVFDLQDWGKVARAVAFTDADIGRFQWVNDDWLVFNGVDLEAGGGDQRFAPGLFSVKRDGSELQTLVRPRRDFLTGGQRIGREPLEWNHRLLHVPGPGRDEVIIGEYKYTGTGQPDGVIPKRLNVATGRAQSLMLDTPAATGWMFDGRGEPRLLMAQKQGHLKLMWRQGERWEPLADHDAYEPAFSPVFIDAAGQLYVTHAEGRAGTTVLSRFDFDARRPQRDPMVRTPGFDFRGGVIADSSGKALGVRVVTDAETTIWFDERLKAVQQEADRRIPGRINRLSCRRCGAPDMTVLIESWSDRDPGQYTVLRPGAEGKPEWRTIGPVRKAIDPARMGTQDFERIKARDGADLPLWLTFPPGPRGNAPLPAVVLVHGGPWVPHRAWRWSADAQFLASRGYLVIEPDFRGTVGYGHAHFRASFKQWGLTMQDDVADALLWAVKQGHADPKRACIAGASYGGYATLMGLVRHPELYRCGAAWVAVTDPRLMFEWSSRSDQSDEVRSYTYPRMIGDPVADAAQLRDTAPVEQAARIKAPVLLAMGREDRRVPLVHGHRMRDALNAAGNPPDWVVYDDEGHGWLKVANRIDFALRLEKFLAQHLK